MDEGIKILNEQIKENERWIKRDLESIETDLRRIEITKKYLLQRENQVLQLRQALSVLEKANR